MLISSLGITHQYKPRGGRRYDCGDGTMRTVREIALATGCDASAIYARIKLGWTGRELLRGYRTKLFDCGDGEMLSIKQIMQRTGLAESAVRSRISRGYKGRALLRKDRKDAAAPRSSTMVIACKLADSFPDRMPTTAEIRKLYPMCAQSSERWLAALKAARSRS